VRQHRIHGEQRGGVARVASIALSLAAFLQASSWPDAAARAQEKSVRPGINKPFEKPDVAEYQKRFETDDREVYAKRAAIADALGLRPGMAVLDLGAGTGLFTREIAARVGAEGKVYAADIAQPFLDHIAAEAKKAGQTQVITVRSTQDACGLPAQSIDLAFVCDVYHHLEYPARMLASLRQALRPGGRLIIVELDRHEHARQFVREHVRATRPQVIAEVEAAGFAKISAPVAAGLDLKENFVVEFRKLQKSPAAAPGPGSRAPSSR
jgi:ubiquinone/menaquinone biosynthesis C-methylase UbiE